MKTNLVLKLVIGLPVLVFVDYLIMAALGCVSCLLGFGDDYFCGPYCMIGKAILLFSLIGFGWFIYPDVKKMIRSKYPQSM